MNTQEKLERYSDLQERLDVLRKNMQELIDKVPIPQEIVDQWNSIKAEFQPMIDVAQAELDTILDEIKTEVLAGGSTVKGSRVMAVWAKGRESWDGRLLSGYALAHPDVLPCKKVGEPTVSMRNVK
jgi:hypothetical protein